MPYRVTFLEEARGEFKTYSRRVQRMIRQLARRLAHNPEPPESSPLTGEWQGHRVIRIAGMLRVLYTVDHRARLVDIVRIRGRGSAYDRP